MTPSDPANETVAVIGMAGRFPRAKDLEEFWRNLCEGVESVSFFKDDELRGSLLDGPPPRDNPNFVKARAVLEDADLFDAAFFGVDSKEAEIMDPQHRLFLECAWEALEIAGYNPDTYGGLIGLFAGSSPNTYLLSNLLTNRELIKTLGKRNFPVSKLTLLASARSVGRKLKFRNQEIAVDELTKDSFKGIDIALFSAGGGISKEFAPRAANESRRARKSVRRFKASSACAIAVHENLSCLR